MGLPMLRRFLKDKAANIAVVSAIAIVPTIALIGGGADIVRVTSIRSELRAAVESSVLAAASLNAQTDIEAVVNNYLDVNLADYPEFRKGLVLDVDYVNEPLSRVVSVTASGKISTNFLGLVSIDELPVTASAEAREGKTSLEVSMVLDVSGSMSGTRLSEMKTGAVEFVDLILTDANKAYTAVSVVPFSNNVNIGQALFDSHAVPMASAVVDPDETTYRVGSSIPGSDFRFTVGTTCLEYEDSHYSDALLPSEALTEGPPTVSGDIFCPTTEAVFNSNDKTTINTAINSLSADGWTGMGIGTLWGTIALSPHWRGLLGGDHVDQPADYGATNVLKVMIIMTDGATTSLYRPYNPNRYTGSYQTIQSAGSISDDPTAFTSTAHVKRLCDQAAANGVVVFTIGYETPTTGAAADLLAYCASDPSRNLRASTVNITNTFESIASSVNALRITG